LPQTIRGFTMHEYILGVSKFFLNLFYTFLPFHRAQLEFPLGIPNIPKSSSWSTDSLLMRMFFPTEFMNIKFAINFYFNSSYASSALRWFGRQIANRTFLWILAIYVHVFQKRAKVQGCQIFLATTYQNGEKCTKLPQNIPNGHKIFPTAVKYT
jgi:hypothetical protein